jgi:cell division protein FtsZ
MLFEVEQAANRIRAEVDPDANIIFGNTILDDMEGRIRVSVVATGIDVVEQKQPEKVHPLRVHIKPVFMKTEAVPDSRFEPKGEPRPGVRIPVQANAVHRQHETIAEELGAAQTTVQPRAAAEPEAMVLGEDEDTRTLEEKYPVTVTVRPIPQHRPDLGNAPLRGPLQEPERRLFGLLGRKKTKDEPRVEPQPQRAAQQSRATSQIMTRPLAEPQRPPAGAQPEDLFPDHKKDEQFEIPAFLRRQTN